MFLRHGNYVCSHGRGRKGLRWPSHRRSCDDPSVQTAVAHTLSAALRGESWDAWLPEAETTSPRVLLGEQLGQVRCGNFRRPARIRR
jgi:hypothetical protein